VGTLGLISVGALRVIRTRVRRSRKNPR
jgi:hypothetical protein